MPDILKAQKKEKVFTWKGEIIMYEDNDMRKDDSFATGSYYDTSSSYTHYDSAEAMKQPKKPKKKGGFGKTVAKCLVLALVFGSVSGAAFTGVRYAGGQLTGESGASETAQTSTTVSPTTVSTQSNDVYDVSDIVANCISSVVSISNVGTTEFQTIFGTYQQESQSSGSGIIIGQNDTELLIVTNYHVISGANELSVYFNSDNEAADDANVISASVKGSNEDKDIAVIAVQLSDIPEETLNDIKVATVGDSTSLEVGEPVVAIGNAYGFGLSVTSGIVSALNREVTATNEDGSSTTQLMIQTDAAINPGNSGGALLNSKGELIGINSVKFVSEDVEGMGYAIPISDVESIINELMLRETRDRVSEDEKGYLGITCLDVTDQASQSYNIPAGVYVSTVTDGAAARQAGIQTGDIITGMEGNTITGSDQLIDLLGYYSAGETVTLTIQRGNGTQYEEINVDVTLSSAQEAGAVATE